MKPDAWLLRLWLSLGGTRAAVQEVTGLYEDELDELEALVESLEESGVEPAGESA